MATWKKLITTGDTIPVGDGGTGLIAAGNGVMVGNGSAISYQGLGDGKILVGTGAGTNVEVGTFAQDTSTDILVSAGSSITMTIGANRVLGTMIADDAVTWADHVDSAYTSVSLAYFDATGNPQVFDVSSAGANEVLQWTGSAFAWASLGNATTVSIGTANTGTFNVVLESAAGNTLLTDDETSFTYDVGGNMLTVPAITSTLTGTATAATQVTTMEDDTNSTACPIMFQSTTAAGAGKAIQINQSQFNYVPSSNTLTVGNLVVNDTTTTLKTENLTVEDAMIQVAVPSTDGQVQQDATAANLTPGLEVHVTNAAGVDLIPAALPSIKYIGGTAGTSPTGWRVTKYGTDTVGVVTGVASMDFENINGTTAMGNTISTSSDIGIGAFKLCSGGELWIQTD